MDNNKEQSIEKEIISEEYKLGKEYYNKILDKAKKDTHKYE